MSEKTMQAVIVRSFGGTDVLELAALPIPEPGRGQVRIAVEAAAVNPADIATRAGFLSDAGLMVPGEYTAIGWDAAGTVDAVGDGVVGFAPGDRVIGLRDRLTAPVGAQAEFVALDADAVAHAPRTASAAEASTLPLNGLTAVQSLDLLALAPGEWLLVTGAAGAVGGFAVELAALRGLRVVAVARPADEELVRGFGAELFVPAYRRAGARDPGRRAGWRARGTRRGRDRGGRRSTPCAAVGRSSPSWRWAPAFPLRGTRIDQVWIRADGARLGELAALVDAGRLTLRVAGTYPLAEVAAAQEQLAAGGLRGRLVLEVG